MKGSNEMKLNKATVIDALQYYFDSKFRPGMSPKVTAVKYVYDDFIATMDEPDLADIKFYLDTEKFEREMKEQAK